MTSKADLSADINSPVLAPQPQIPNTSRGSLLPRCPPVSASHRIVLDPAVDASPLTGCGATRGETAGEVSCLGRGLRDWSTPSGCFRIAAAEGYCITSPLRSLKKAESGIGQRSGAMRRLPGDGGKRPRIVDSALGRRRVVDIAVGCCGSGLTSVSQHHDILDGKFEV